MYSLKALALALVVALDAFSAVQATLYIIQPSSGSTCSGGQPCTVQWLDDGTNPLNSDIGVTTCGLYTGDMQLVQSIPAVNVANTQSLTFTPIPDAGPDSSDYYIAFTSQNLTINGTNFTGYSSFFSLNNMSGSFSSPLASATSTIPIPSTLTDSSASTETGVLSTITVGSVDTSLLSISIISATPASSGFTTSTLVSSSAIATLSSSSSVSSSSGSTPSSSVTGASSSSNDATPKRIITLPLLGVLSLTTIILYL